MNLRTRKLANGKWVAEVHERRTWEVAGRWGKMVEHIQHKWRPLRQTDVDTVTVHYSYPRCFMATEEKAEQRLLDYLATEGISKYYKGTMPTSLNVTGYSACEE